MHKTEEEEDNAENAVDDEGEGGVPGTSTTT
jgi:hypothetical protein